MKLKRDFLREYFSRKRGEIMALPDTVHKSPHTPEFDNMEEYFRQRMDDIYNDKVKPTELPKVYHEEKEGEGMKAHVEILSNANDDNKDSSTKSNPLLKYKPYFDKAVEKGYMEALPDGTYRWKKYDVDLAYFIGALYCGDTVEVNKTYNEWKKGNKKFPAKNVIDLFGKDVAQVRRNRTSKKAQISSPPQSYFGINILIKEVKKSLEETKENEPKK